MTRAYLRLDPATFERKAIQQGYSPSEFAAFVGVLCLAEAQPERGRFRDERLLRALLGKLGRLVPDLLTRGDLVVQPDGRLYVDGWDEWQEGDLTVKDRMARMRGRQHAARDAADRNTERNGHRNTDRHRPSRHAMQGRSDSTERHGGAESGAGHGKGERDVLDDDGPSRSLRVVDPVSA